MKPLSALYGLAVKLRNNFYDEGSLRVQRLNAPVISVGNIRVGGTGKTPFVIALGRRLLERGINFDVLSRGYRRRTKDVQLVNPNGPAEQFGDEPLLIAQSLGVPVIVADKRFEAGQLAEARYATSLHLLDDGFQHRQLARDFDIVLLTSGDLADTLLPSGRLREPLNALGRADVIALPAGTDSTPLSRFNKPVWQIERKLQLPPEMPQNPVVFCGLARPQQFVAELAASGIRPAAIIEFPDHHKYSRKDVEQIRWAAERNQADGYVTTEKDRMNLGQLAELLRPVVFPVLTIELADAERCVSWMLDTIEARRKRRS